MPGYTLPLFTRARFFLFDGNKHLCPYNIVYQLKIITLRFARDTARRLCAEYKNAYFCCRQIPASVKSKHSVRVSLGSPAIQFALHPKCDVKTKEIIKVS